MHRPSAPALLATLAVAAACGAPSAAPPPPAGPRAPTPADRSTATRRPANFNALSLGKGALGAPAGDAARAGSPRTGAVAGAGAAVAHLNAPLGVPSFIWAEGAGTPAAIARAASPTGAGAPHLVAARGPVDTSRAHLAAVAPRYGLAPAEAEGAELVRIHDTGRGPLVVTFRQRPGGLEVFREEANVLLTRRMVPVAVTGRLSSRAAAASAAARGALDGPAAVAAALTDLTGEAFAAADLSARSGVAGFLGFDLAPGVAAARAERLTRPAGAKQLWFRLPAGLELAWQVEVSLARAGEPDALDYGYVLSAVDGRVLFRIDHRADQAFSYRVWASDPLSLLPDDGPQGLAGTPHPTGLPDGYQAPLAAPGLVTLANLPFSAGDPWLAAGATETTGNNVDAYADLSASDGFTPASLDRRAAVTAPGVFDHLADPALGPRASTAQVDAAVVQLFYDVNALHDWFYDAGFDEAAGNAQALNYGRGGVGGDPLAAQAQDSSGLNNANMTTPPDGFPPRMQMFVWSNSDLMRVSVTAPAEAAGPRAALPALFGPQAFSVSGPLALAAPADGCTAFTAPAPAPGAVALVDRGTCTFVVKVRNAQLAGYAGVVVRLVDPAQTLLTMSGTDGTITIPALIVAQPDGAALAAAVAAAPVGGVSVTLDRSPGVQRDGTLDALIVAHEWGHYLTNRLVHDASGLDTVQAGAMGEGWGDFVALLQAVRAEDAAAAANADWAGVYAMAGWATSGLDRTGAPNQGYYYGIRRTPYSTDMTRAPLTFRHVADGEPLPDVTPPLHANGAANAEVHNAGEVWAGVLWECYAALLRDTQGPAPRLDFDEARRRMREYLVASLKLLPDSPTFLEGRDALVAAAAAGDPIDASRFWAAFAKRGFGLGAAGPADRFGLDNAGVVESYALGGELAVEGVTFGAVTSGCDDADGTLDAGEAGTLTLSLRNTGTGPLPALDATISTTHPGLTFPDGPAVTVGPSAAGGVATAAVRVALAGAAPGQLAELALAFPDGALAVPTTLPVQLRLDVDVQPAAAAVDAFEADPLRWTLAAAPTLYVGAPFRRVALTAADHALLGPDPGAQADLTATSPPLRVGEGGLTLAWRHRFGFEADPAGTPGRLFYDGGVVELSDDGGATWRDVGAPAYGGTIASGYGNPLSGRAAFVATSPGFATPGATDPVTLDLSAACAGGACAGRTVLLRFRVGSDAGVEGPLGWLIDDVAVGGVLDTPFDMVTADARQCVNRAPVADAGADQEVPERTAVLLSAARSSDPDDGASLTYDWIQTGGPAVSLAGAGGPAASFTAPEVAVDTALTFRVTVGDGALGSTAETLVLVRQVNRPPVASAGAGQVADERTTVTLDAAGSTDPDGDAVTSAWSQVAGPAAALSDPTAARPTFTAPEVTGPTDLVFSLVVSDGALASEAATVTVTVLDVNRPPVASAGADQEAGERSTVTITGAASDPDGDALSCIWTQVAGPAVTLAGADTLAVAFTAPEVTAPEDVVLRLTVSDGRLEAVSQVTVLVVDVNRPPVASAGADQQVEERTPVTLRGNASFDPDLDPLTYAWTQTGGPVVGLSDPAAARPTFGAPEVAADTALTFQLTVSDGRLARTASTQVLVRQANRAPAASAGLPQAAGERSTVTLDGSGSSDPDRDPLTFSWTQVGGPAANLSDAAAVAPTFTAPEVDGPTDLTFTLVVRDGAADSAAASVTVTVVPVNRPPTADAGADRATDERATVSITGAAADPDGDAVGAGLTVAWSQVAGPAVALIGADTLTVTFTAPEVTGPEDLVLRLTVSDGDLQAESLVTVHLVDVNRPPVASAGAPQVVDAGAGVTLDASGSSDADADALAFAWRQVAGPTVALGGADTARPTFTAPALAADDALTFEVTVGDGAATSAAAVTVTVRAAVVQPAGGCGGCSSGGGSPLSAVPVILGLALLRRRRAARP